MKQVKIMKLKPDAILPTHGSAGAAGWDLYANRAATIYPGDKEMIGTGLAMAIPFGYEGEIRPRSGMACKKGLRPANTPGTIDCDYRGEIIVCLHNDSPFPQTIEKGDRIAQILFKEVPQFELIEVDELDETERSDGGFGSTGEK